MFRTIHNLGPCSDLNVLPSQVMEQSENFPLVKMAPKSWESLVALTGSDNFPPLRFIGLKYSMKINRITC